MAKTKARFLPGSRGGLSDDELWLCCDSRVRTAYVALLRQRFERGKSRQDVIFAAQQLLAVHPTDPELLMALGDFWAASQNHYESVRHYEAAKAHSKNTAQLDNRIAKSYLRQGKFAAAIQAFNETLGQHPNEPEAFTGLCRALQQQYNNSTNESAFLDELIAAHERWLANDRRHSADHAHAAAALWERAALGDPDGTFALRAEQHYVKAIAINAHCREAYAAKAKEQHRRGEFVAAERLYGRALEANSRGPSRTRLSELATRRAECQAGILESRLENGDTSMEAYGKVMCSLKLFEDALFKFLIANGVHISAHGVPKLIEKVCGPETWPKIAPTLVPLLEAHFGVGTPTLFGHLCLRVWRFRNVYSHRALRDDQILAENTLEAAALARILIAVLSGRPPTAAPPPP